MSKQQKIVFIASFLVIVFLIATFSSCQERYLQTFKEEKSNQPEEKTQGSVPRSLEVAEISEAESLSVDDFIKKEKLNEENASKVRDLMSYDKRIDSGGKNTADITIVKNKEDIIYFQSEQYIFDLSVNRPIIYSLNLKNQELKKIFEGDSNEFRYDLLGITDEKLLFFKDKADTSPGPCFNRWVTGYETNKEARSISEDLQTIQTLDVTKLNTGFSLFSLPIEKYSHEVARQEICRYRMSQQ